MSNSEDVTDVMQRASLRIAELSGGYKTAAEAELQNARAAVMELIDADEAYDAAAESHRRATRELGAFNVNGLARNHPAVIQLVEATKRRRIALARARGIE